MNLHIKQTLAVALTVALGLTILHFFWDNRAFNSTQNQENRPISRQSLDYDSSEISRQRKLALFAKYMQPTLDCGTNKERLGNTDGGYWICNPSRAAYDGCVVYSMGIRGDTSFETALSQKTGNRCRFFCFDDHAETAMNLFAPFNGTFMQARISAKSDPSKKEMSIFDIMRFYNHTKVEILKIDIEEGEFDALNSFFDSVQITPEKTPICQILTEFHAFPPNTDLNVDMEKKLDVWPPMLKRMHKLGFRIFTIETYRRCCEQISFLHVSCTNQYEPSPW